jgi:hypothetical protein
MKPSFAIWGTMVFFDIGLVGVEYFQSILILQLPPWGIEGATKHQKKILDA